MDKTVIANRFYEDSAFCTRESDLMHAILCTSESLDPEAQRHIKRGFNQRLGMIESSRIFLRENAKPSRSVPDTYLLTEMQIHLNTYYLNVRGSLDNFAWALKYQFSLFPDVVEATGKGAGKIYLFRPEFRKTLLDHDQHLVEVLNKENCWDRSLQRWRDPAAHRIPLFIPPSVIDSDEKVAEFKRFDSLAGADDESRKGKRRIEFMDEARNLGTFQPWFTTEDVAGEPRVHCLPLQIAEDHEHFLDVSEAVINALGMVLPR